MPLFSIAASASGVSFALDPVIGPPLPWQSGAGPVKRETGLKRMPSVNSVYKKKVLNKSEAVEEHQISQALQPSFTLSEEQSITVNPSAEKVDEPVAESSVSVEREFSMIQKLYLNVLLVPGFTMHAQVKQRFACDF